MGAKLARLGKPVSGVCPRVGQAPGERGVSQLLAVLERGPIAVIGTVSVALTVGRG